MRRIVGGPKYYWQPNSCTSGNLSGCPWAPAVSTGSPTCQTRGRSACSRSKSCTSPDAPPASPPWTLILVWSFHRFQRRRCSGFARLYCSDRLWGGFGRFRTPVASICLHSAIEASCRCLGGNSGFCLRRLQHCRVRARSSARYRRIERFSGPRFLSFPP